MKILLFYFLLFFISCTGSNSNQTKTIEYKEYNVTSREFPNEILIRIPRINILGNRLLVSSYNPAPVLRLYDIGKDSLELITTYGSIGRAGNEFLVPIVSDIVKDTVIIYDINARKVKNIVYDSKDNELREVSSINVSQKKTTEGYIFSDLKISKLSNGSYVGVALHSSGEIFSYYDKDMNFSNYFGELDFLPGITGMTAIQELQGNFNIKGDNIVFGMIRMPYLMMYTMKKDTIVKSWDADICPIDVTVAGDGVIRYKIEKRGKIQAMTLGDKYIYLGFNDAPVVKIASQVFNFIYVYNYEGERVAKLNLDRGLLGSMCVNADETKLYGKDGESGSIVEFDLSEVQ
ncbi:MAG: hypothetical protein R3Y26_11770 [Rikenellaceae bacterium]